VTQPSWVDKPFLRLPLLIFIAMLAAGSARAGGLIELPQKPAAPVLDLTDLAGKRHEMAQYRGRVVVVNFWATWCAPCRRELPSLQKAAEKFKPDNIAVLAVNVGEPADRIARFLSDRGVSFPVLADPKAKTPGPWQIQGMPTTYIIDKDGRIYYGAIGERDWTSAAVTRQLRDLNF
jgi:thiol-disulfide isomerase/thioredoxin